MKVKGLGRYKLGEFFFSLAVGKACINIYLDLLHALMG